MTFTFYSFKLNFSYWIEILPEPINLLLYWQYNALTKLEISLIHIHPKWLFWYLVSSYPYNAILQNIPVPRTMTWFNGILLPTTQICAVMPENNKTVYWMFSTSDIKLLKYRWFLTSALVLVKVNFDKLLRSSRFSSFVNTDWFKENSARKSSYAKCIKKRGTKLKNGKSLLMI